MDVVAGVISVVKSERIATTQTVRSDELPLFLTRAVP